MSDTDRPIRLLLDTSAILAYTRGSIEVGELLSEVSDEGGVVGLPTLCLSSVDWMVEDRARLDLLVKHQVTAVLGDTGDWAARAELGENVGQPDAVAAVMSAIDLDCDVLTGRPGLYGGLDDGGPVLAIMM